jgi:type I restriction enzyme S subunit
VSRDWITVPLGKVVTLQRGYDLPNRWRRPGAIPIVTSSGIGGTHNEAMVSGPGVVTGRYGTIGEVFYIQGDFWPLNTTLFVRDFHGNDPLFVSYLLRTIDFQTHSGKSGVPGVNRNDLHEVLVSLPRTKAEQEAVAEALGDADALIESLEQLIAKKRQIKQGAMRELLTGKKRLPGFSGEWEVKRLGDLLSGMANGAVYKPTNSFGLPITRIETISDGTIDYSRTGTAEASAELENYKLVSGDILFSHINSLDHIGKVAQFLGEQDLYHGMNLLLLRANKDADSRFLYFWFTSAPARKKARNLAKQAVSQASINTTELKALELLLPPVPEQTAIAAILSDMDAEIAALEEKLVKACELKQGMMHELLTGRTRLVESSK